MIFSVSRVNVFGVIGAALVAAGCATNAPAPVSDRSVRPAASTGGSPRPVVVQPDPRPTPSVAPPVIERAAPPAVISGAPIGAPIGAQGRPLPPVSAAQPGNTAGSQFHVVQRGENLYRIALNNGVDLNSLAEWNGITPLTPIREGQVLRLRPNAAATAATATPNPIPGGASAPGSIVSVTPIPSSPASPQLGDDATLRREPRAVRAPYSDAALASMQREQAPSTAASPALPAGAPNASTGTADSSRTAPPATAGAANPPSAAVNPEPDIRPGSGVEREGVVWTWPTAGRVASKFNDKGAMKGIDIAASAGTAVVAAAAGKVIYVGKEPRGFGQMLVVSHAKETVSVYFHTDKVIVREQQRVTLGQRLAEVSESSGNKMHFEVRRQGRPIDPITLMPARN